MSSQIFSKPLPYLALIIAHLIWGANFVVAKVTLQEFPPMSLALLRFSLATLLIAPFFYAERKKFKVSKKDLPQLIAIGILIITLNITFFFEGIRKTTAINASVLTLIIPMLSVLLGWWFLKEKIFLINLLGVIAGLFGAIIIVGVPELFLGETSPQVLLGNFLIILAATVWVFGAILSRKMLKKYPSLLVTGIAFGVGTITFLIPAAREYLANPVWPSQVTMLGILGLIYMTLLSSISAYFLFEWGLARTSVIKADLFQYIEPFIAATLAVILLGEIITIPFIVGAVLITAGVYLGTLAKELHHKAYKTHRV
ncbi:EamA family transporter [Candidatus Daviesbacteria bacterium]|nr:EamA family transporter [Candidatus Daviesbacteria bacterium]